MAEFDWRWVESINTKQRFDDYTTSYNPFLVNRALSYSTECIQAANDMNKYHFLDHDIQYTYLYESINKKKRFGSKWSKLEKTDDISAIIATYGVNRIRAKEILALLSAQQLDVIKQKLYKGGR